MQKKLYNGTLTVLCNDVPRLMVRGTITKELIMLLMLGTVKAVDMILTYGCASILGSVILAVWCEVRG